MACANETYTGIFIPADPTQDCRPEEIPRDRAHGRIAELVGSLFPLIDSTSYDDDARFWVNRLHQPLGLPINERATTYAREQSTAAALRRGRGAASPVADQLQGDIVLLGEAANEQTGMTELADAPARFSTVFGLDTTPSTDHPTR